MTNEAFIGCIAGIVAGGVVAGLTVLRNAPQPWLAFLVTAWLCVVFMVPGGYIGHRVAVRRLRIAAARQARSFKDQQ